VRRDTELAVLPGTLSEEALADRFRDGAAYAVMKLGRNFAKVRRALQRAGALDRALYIERATMTNERVVPIADVDPQAVPYFSLVIVPGIETRTDASATRGTLTVVGLGPGSPQWLSPEARRALTQATDLVGYRPYLERVPAQPRQARHSSENRVEIDRARHALALAVEGRQVCVVSSGDPGIFAMAAAVLEEYEQGNGRYAGVEVRVIPGLSAMQAAAARVGAPLGHDFCVLSLSDIMKPWEIVERRLRAAGEADLVLALYNPASRARRQQLARALEILRDYRAPQTPVVVARAVGSDSESVSVTTLARVDLEVVDMRTLLIVGSSTTRVLPGETPHVYTPRRYPAST
jgi:precorrin-2 C20-methyltransferase/precorrin-3B C17-methyltransferase